MALTDKQKKALNALEEYQPALKAQGETAGLALGDLIDEADSQLSRDAIDGNRVVKTARATYDFAVNGGAISAIGLGTLIPNNAVIMSGGIDVVTTLTTAGADAGTIAISVEGANDIVAAIAVSDVSNPWDAGGQNIIPNGTGATSVKTTAEREITATIAVQAVTAGKFVVFLNYVISD
jgi:hypothetical protein